MVHHAARAQVALALLLVSGALAGCFGGGPGSVQNGPAFGTPIRLADCSDWITASPAQRASLIEGIKAFSGGPSGSPPLHGRTLDDDKAYNLFEVDCRADFAKRFALYKLYVRAAAFGGG